MSKEPGQTLYEATGATIEWSRLPDHTRLFYNGLESAIRADEAAKVIEECAKVVEARPPRFFDTPEVQHRQTVAAIRAKGAEHG